jgi:hypothetical protein
VPLSAEMLQKNIHLMESVANEPLLQRQRRIAKSTRSSYSSNHCGASTPKSRLKLTLNNYQTRFTLCFIVDDKHIMHFANKSPTQGL